MHCIATDGNHAIEGGGTEDGAGAIALAVEFHPEAIAGGGHAPASPGLDLPGDLRIPGHKFVKDAAMVNANHRHGFHPAEDAPPSTASREGQIGFILKGVAVQPKPFLWKCTAPIFFGIGGGILERVAIALPINPATGQTMGHEDLPTGFKNLQLGEPAGRRLLGLIDIAPAVDGLNLVVPGAGTHDWIAELALVLCGGALVTFLNGAMEVIGF